ncbi:MAG: Gfo/Idh/MocA family oxidoreductase [Anaerolineae bacterium]
MVSIATPAGLRGEVVEAATALGCNIVSEKPLATTAEEAWRIYRLAADAGIKHAYAATHRYGPGIAWLRELIQSGRIGTLRDILATYCLPLSPLTPWCWAHSLANGGGLLNQELPHLLGVLERLAGGEVTRVMGEARIERRSAPVVPGLHDFRVTVRTGFGLTQEAAAKLEWRPVDAETAYSALMRFRAPDGQVRVTVIDGMGRSAGHAFTGIHLYGTAGALHLEDLTSQAAAYLAYDAETPESLPVPQQLQQALPDLGNPVDNQWAALARDFTADLRGEPHDPYLTFHDGWRYQQVIDAIRAGAGWQEIDGRS